MGWLGRSRTERDGAGQGAPTYDTTAAGPRSEAGLLHLHAPLYAQWELEQVRRLAAREGFVAGAFLVLLAYPVLHWLIMGQL